MAFCRFGFLLMFPTKATVLLCRLALFDFKKGLTTCRPLSFCTMIWLMTLDTCTHTQPQKLQAVWRRYWFYFFLRHHNTSSSYNAFICREVLQHSAAGLLRFFPLARVEQRQVRLQSFGVDKPTSPARAGVLNDGKVKVTLEKRGDKSNLNLFSTYNVCHVLSADLHKLISLPEV